MKAPGLICCSLCLILFAQAGLAQAELAQDFGAQLSEQAIKRTTHRIRYDGAYRSIGYPGGDVPDDIGVCTDVVIRAYRGLGIDLQQLVHEDMRAHFADYPSKRLWGLSRADSNIDHRRVPNLRAFFERHGTSLPLSTEAADYKPGDIVTWNLSAGLTHIGVVSAQKARRSGQPLIVHNIGAGPQLEDVLFSYEMTGHYRFKP